MPAQMPARHDTRARALVVTHSYYTRDTRPRRHATALAEGGWEVEVLCARDAGESRRDQAGPVAIRRLPARRRRGSKYRYVFEYASFAAMALGAMAGMHARRRYDLIYVFSIPNILVRAAAVPRMRGARVVLDVRDPMPEFFRSRYDLPGDHRLVRALLAEERISCRYADHIVTVHESLQTLLLRTGVGADRIGVVMNAPDPAVFTAPESGRRDGDDRTMLYAGTVADRYGVDLLVRAVARLNEKIPALRLRIVGDGDAVPRLAALARELGVADRVAFDGPVRLDRIPAIVRSSWMGAQPHREDPLMHYCFSTKVLEWCALGTPVLVSRTEAFDSSFSDRELTFVRPGDFEDLCAKILDAHDNPAELGARAEAARLSVARFDWARQRETLLEIAGRWAAKTHEAPRL